MFAKPARPSGTGRRFAPITTSVAFIAASLVSAAIFAVPAQAATNDPPVRLPDKPTGLTAPVPLSKTLDPVPSYQPQTSCQPYTQVGIAKLRTLIMKTYNVGYAGRTVGPCTEGVSEHSEGRAFDWMVNVKNADEKAAAADFLAWVTRNNGENARRLGIMYVIYNQKIWGAYRARDGWRPSSGHLDHVHISMSWNGARGRVSFWKGKPQTMDYGSCGVFRGEYGVPRASAFTRPCRTPEAVVRTVRRPVVQFGSTGAAVADARRLLGISAGNRFDYDLRNAVKRWQSQHDLPVTGVLDRPTWTTLDPRNFATSAIQGMTPATAARYGAKTYRSLPLARNAASKPALVLQYALGMDRSLLSSYFGPKTLAAVKDAQSRLDRPVTGVWNAGDWDALVASNAVS